VTHSRTTRTNRKPFRAVVGAAHHTLRAYAKAYSLAAGDGTLYRYDIPHNGRTASIVDAAGNAVMSRPIEEWAAEGPAIRLALIGLKALKERLERAAANGDNAVTVVFSLDVLRGTASLSVDGTRLTREQLLQAAPTLSLSDGLLDACGRMGDGELTSIADWAMLGRQFEIDFFQVLQSAEKYGFTEAARAERERGYRLGIIRRKRNGAAPAERTDAGV
jgi:hypothetical protein